MRRRVDLQLVAITAPFALLQGITTLATRAPTAARGRWGRAGSPWSASSPTGWSSPARWAATRTPPSSPRPGPTACSGRRCSASPGWRCSPPCPGGDRWSSGSSISSRWASSPSPWPSRTSARCCAVGPHGRPTRRRPLLPHPRARLRGQPGLAGLTAAAPDRAQPGDDRGRRLRRPRRDALAVRTTRPPGPR